MNVLQHPCNGTKLKVVCEACGDLAIKAIDLTSAPDSTEIRCRRCNAIRGTVADLRELARRSSDEFEF
jgi:hypothetical protein